MTAQPRLAVIDDDPILRELIVGFLTEQGYPVWSAASAEVFYKNLLRQPADIVLVDLTLPGEDGLAVIDYLRRTSERGLIAVTSRGEVQDRVNGLSLGADYYVVKPIHLLELEVTIAALWRRMLRQAPWTRRGEAWRLDPAQRRLYAPDGISIALSEQEYTLLHLLLAQANQVVAKERLHQTLFPQEPQMESHRIEVIVSRIRRKAGQAGFEVPLRAVFGKGLVFVQGDWGERPGPGRPP
ncbi:MAG TPA: response regulator transcription factor [Chromatiaceae bacterium]|nr:response regulator transcription factor [Chromatiaceae bacterium]